MSLTRTNSGIFCRFSRCLISSCSYWEKQSTSQWICFRHQTHFKHSNVSRSLQGIWTCCSFCCLLHSSISRSEGRRCARSFSLCNSSLRCSNTRFNSGFSSSRSPLQGQAQLSHLPCFFVSNESVNVLKALLHVPFMAEQQLSVQSLLARCVQFSGLEGLIWTAVCCVTVQSED